MVLIDTSAWVMYFRNGNIGLETLLHEYRVVYHPFIVGEHACGNLKNRAEILSLLPALPMAIHGEHEEVMRFIEDHRLMGKGLGYIDIHLIASALLTEVLLWTVDKKLNEISIKLGINY
ncbi:MAG: PIN domain protein [Candidatus Jettenia ecosi]|uniref:PIN domain protein n=1 Tax=Candidatus Jettenia ecosi TaxID=2494326 RepID=A0A533Q5Y7_9BACT|nr:MAG: PIN domain protein [Candidatus Jettenia ecosi]